MKKTKKPGRKQAKSKNKKKPSKNSLPEKMAKSFAEMMEGKAHALGLPAKIDREYEIPLVNPKFIIYFENENPDGTKIMKPRVLHAGMIDVLLQKGYESLECNMLPPISCREAGCYGANPGDFMQRAACKIQLRPPKNSKGIPGRWARLEGDACRHNSPDIISGNAQIRANAMRRLAETRSMDRVISNLLNLGAIGLLELPQLNETAKAKYGDIWINANDINKIIQGDFNTGNPAEMPASSKPVENERQRAEKAQEAHEQPQHTPEWLASNRALHKMLNAHGLGGNLTDAAHKWIIAMAEKAFHKKIESVGLLGDDEIAHVVKYLETCINQEEWAAIYEWCKSNPAQK